MTPYGFVYLITNTVNGKVYVGQTVQSVAKRFGQHCSAAKRNTKNIPICNAIRKYGPDAFTVTRLCEAYSIEELDARETALILRYDARNPTKGYNVKEGGQSHRMAESTKRKIGAANSVALKGKKASLETRRKRSQSINARLALEPRKPHSAETRRRIGEAGKGRPAWNKGRHLEATDGTPKQIDLRKRIVELRAAGSTFTAIATMLGMKDSNTRALYNRWVDIYLDSAA